MQRRQYTSLAFWATARSQSLGIVSFESEERDNPLDVTQLKPQEELLLSLSGPTGTMNVADSTRAA